MSNNSINNLLGCSEQVFDELYAADTIVSITKNSCMEREFSGQYYGTSGKESKKLSEERNNYINMLTILSEKISNLKRLTLSIEKEILLQKNSDNSRRKITAQCSANKCP